MRPFRKAEEEEDDEREGEKDLAKEEEEEEEEAWEVGGGEKPLGGELDVELKLIENSGPSESPILETLKDVSFSFFLHQTNEKRAQRMSMNAQFVNQGFEWLISFAGEEAQAEMRVVAF
eukprot:CAMPEP_0201540418 /NCGR_PEP_ID=MMETSP0161_2-20130828/70933_1 /ASSEMBLY_ACC=CAM_ASM_000251 /TAXON_ID=180227 /ORGANISM="Neoparamoeba aestuarina, Strain SoJaBio B1-5/56/2" /LENGTH=118 /DNA_ID=CAMNT_0047947887 /DNA_START=772 /DNA_END=1130 /DNA_ORIENTATION=+